MYLSYEQITVDATNQQAGSLHIPAKATHAELQADTGSIRYTMDNVTNPSSTFGMLLLTTEPPKQFLIDDIRRIRFTQGSGAAKLNIHYFAGRNI